MCVCGRCGGGCVRCGLGQLISTVVCVSLGSTLSHTSPGPPASQTLPSRAHGRPLAVSWGVGELTDAPLPGPLVMGLKTSETLVLSGPPRSARNHSHFWTHTDTHTLVLWACLYSRKWSNLPFGTRMRVSVCVSLFHRLSKLLRSVFALI